MKSREKQPGASPNSGGDMTPIPPPVETPLGPAHNDAYCNGVGL